MSPRVLDDEDDFEAGDLESSDRNHRPGRRRRRVRKRASIKIITPTWRWWHVALAVAVALIGGLLTIFLLRDPI